jgi:hypothetical protein
MILESQMSVEHFFLKRNTEERYNDNAQISPTIDTWYSCKISMFITHDNCKTLLVQHCVCKDLVNQYDFYITVVHDII